MRTPSPIAVRLRTAVAMANTTPGVVTNQFSSGLQPSSFPSTGQMAGKYPLSKMLYPKIPFCVRRQSFLHRFRHLKIHIGNKKRQHVLRIAPVCCRIKFPQLVPLRVMTRSNRCSIRRSSQNSFSLYPFPPALSIGGMWEIHTLFTPLALTHRLQIGIMHHERGSSRRAGGDGSIHWRFLPVRSEMTRL